MVFQTLLNIVNFPEHFRKKIFKLSSERQEDYLENIDAKLFSILTTGFRGADHWALSWKNLSSGFGQRDTQTSLISFRD